MLERISHHEEISKDAAFAEGYELGVIDTAEALLRVIQDHGPEAAESAIGELLCVIRGRRSQLFLEALGISERSLSLSSAGKDALSK